MGLGPVKGGGNMFSVISILILLGALWIGLRVLTMFVEIPFRVIDAIFSLPLSILFWVILIACIVTAVLQRR